MPSDRSAESQGKPRKGGGSTEPSGKGVRGPHAERTAAMRKRLIEAAIESLVNLGYGATTLQVVTDAAGVSRGAVLHHFPTRVDLMIAVAEYAADKQNRYVGHQLRDTPPGIDRYISITRAAWNAHIQPVALALLELMMGSRSDPELGARFPSVMQALEAQQRADVWAEAQALGIRDQEAVLAMEQLHKAALRGLALDLMLSRDAGRAGAAVDLLVRYKQQITGQLLTQN
jgi:AcrR family transcriptional regulator